MSNDETVLNCPSHELKRNMFTSNILAENRTSYDTIGVFVANDDKQWEYNLNDQLNETNSACCEPQG